MPLVELSQDVVLWQGFYHLLMTALGWFEMAVGFGLSSWFLLRWIRGRNITTQIPGYRPWGLLTSRDVMLGVSTLNLLTSALGVAFGFSPPCVVHLHEERFRHHWRKHFKFAESKAPCFEKTFHGHPRLASIRRGIHEQAAKLLIAKGYLPYDISSSRRSNRLGSSGYHGHFSPRDYGYEQLNKAVDSNRHALVLIDVDYYVDMHALAVHMVPMVLWTFDPPTDVGSNEECAWRVDGSMYRFSVHGGCDYVHPAWEYGSTDYVMFRVGYTDYLYSIERFRPEGSPHQLVMLQPVTCGLNLPSTHRVSRRTFGDRIYRDGDCVVITSGSLHFRLKAELYETVASKLKSKDFAVHSLVQYLREHKADVLFGDVCYLGQWLFDKRGKDSEVSGLVFASVVVRSDGTHYSNVLKDTHVREIPAPTNVEARAPANDRASDAAAVTLRLAAVANSVVPPARFSKYADEFISEFKQAHMNGEASCEPLSEVQVLEHVERAATRRKCQEVIDDPFATGIPDTVEVEAFYKKELYGVPTAERNISPTQNEHLLALSRYTYALKDLMKRSHWYTPGLTPLDIAGAVKDLFQTKELCWETDFSKFDGRISEWLRRNVEKRLYMACFANGGEVGKLIENEISNAKARTRAGTYHTGGSRLSGSPMTTDGNTLLNAYVQYCAFREAGLIVREAYARIGLCYGDDGLMAGDGMDVHMKSTCKELGLVIKLVPAATPDRPYAGFLGRIYPKPGTSTASFQDPNRVWTKIHLTRKIQGIEQMENFAAKIASFYVTDGQSPLLGPYCRKVLELYPFGRKYLKMIERSDFLLSELFDSWILRESKATKLNSWPQENFGPESTELYAALLQVSMNDFEIAVEKVLKAKKIGDLRGLLTLPEPEFNPRVVLGGPFSLGQPLAYDNNVANRVKARPAPGLRNEQKHGKRSSETEKAPSTTAPSSTGSGVRKWVRKSTSASSK